MSEHNDRKRRNRRKANKKTSVNKSIKITLLVLLILIVMAGGTLAGIVLSMVKAAPEIDPSQINLDLRHTSSILDLEGNLIEKIETAEFRTFVSINRMPEHLKQAFIAIEDERFFDHRGVDPKGIVSSALENLKADGIVRGASTITQQLVKNVYLTPEKKWSRKVQEAYLALQVDRALSKEQILEAYLNR
ncbi:MAG TPA: biosynthetic peptidoglycan transglycosylase, partial [Tissierellaceae bacterium]|nr:biosynthetic peptidoglycan transglycosylase [Tissierellaceae bacterium]